MSYKLARAATLFVALAAADNRLWGQDTASLTLQRVRSSARATSPELAAAQRAVEAARARARQAGAFLNPVLSYDREQTGGGGSEGTLQDIVAVEQILEHPGLRGARRDAATLRLSVAAARLRSAESQLDLDVTRAYAEAIAAGRRAVLADSAGRAFTTARTVSEKRLREGDISGFAARRIRLEAARYSALRADANLALATARLALATMSGLAISNATALAEPTADVAVTALLANADSLAPLALRSRPDLAVAVLEVDVAAMETQLASRERFPHATFTLGAKREELSSGDRPAGFVAGLSLPLPAWDRRAGAIEAARAETARRSAELSAVRRNVTREVAEAVEGLRAVEQQRGILGSAVQADAAGALRAAEVAYAEGELSLIELLDTVRAYYETQTTIANLRAELLVRVALLERAVGTSLLQELR